MEMLRSIKMDMEKREQRWDKQQQIREECLEAEFKRNVATPKPDPTRMEIPNQNPGTLDLFLFILHFIIFSFSKVS